MSTTREPPHGTARRTRRRLSRGCTTTAFRGSRRARRIIYPGSEPTTGRRGLSLRSGEVEVQFAGCGSGKRFDEPERARPSRRAGPASALGRSRRHIANARRCPWKAVSGRAGYSGPDRSCRRAGERSRCARDIVGAQFGHSRYFRAAACPVRTPLIPRPSVARARSSAG